MVRLALALATAAHRGGLDLTSSYSCWHIVVRLLVYKLFCRNYLGPSS